MRRRFMLSSGAGDSFPPGIYVSLLGDGSGSGNRPSNAMSYANFLLLVLVPGDTVYFLDGEIF